MPDRNTLPALLALIRSATGCSRELDARIEVAMRAVEAARTRLQPSMWARWRAGSDGSVFEEVYDRSTYASACVTASLDAAALVERMLPGWWWKCGTCCVSDDACIAPDLNSPLHGERLARDLGPIAFNSEFDAGFDVDRRPPGNAPLALLEVLIRALIAIDVRKKEIADA